MPVRSQKLERAYPPPPSWSAFHGRIGSRLCVVTTCGIPWSSFVRWPPNIAYHVCEWTTEAPSASADIARSTDIVFSAGFAPFSSAHGWNATAPSRSSPKHRTSRSMRRARSRARYSTWTPAPPYTSGGYSRVSRIAFTAAQSTDAARHHAAAGPGPILGAVGDDDPYAHGFHRRGPRAALAAPARVGATGAARARCRHASRRRPVARQAPAHARGRNRRRHPPPPPAAVRICSRRDRDRAAVG